jgi:hypothetical protein
LYWVAKLEALGNPSVGNFGNDEMKRTLIWAMVACQVWQALASEASADVVTENLGQPNQALSVFDSTAWIAQSFTTDATAYTLSSISVQVVGFGGGFTLSLYDDNAGNPGVLIDTLVGSSSPNELTTYLPSTTVALSPSTTYYAVAKSSSGTYEWRLTGSTNQTGPGMIGDTAIFTVDSGSTWFPQPPIPMIAPSFVAKLSVEATVVAVPEASAALCLGAIAALAVGVGGLQRLRSAARLR